MMIDQPVSQSPDLADEFPATPARSAVAALVRGFGTVQRLMEPHFDRFDLTPPQFQVLIIVNRLREEPLTQRRLARELYVSFPNVTLLLRRLERKGLVVREGNIDDRRQKLVRITPRGRKLLARIWRIHQQQLDHVMNGLTLPEQQEFTRLLNKMITVHAESPAISNTPHRTKERMPC